jgi:uncharacterized protein (DUF608 family)
MNLKLVGGVALAYIGYNYFKKRAEGLTEFVQSIAARVNNLSFDFSNPLYPKIIIQLVIQNPTTTEITYQSFFANVLLGSENVGTVNSNEQKVIAANSSTSINLPFTVSSVAALKNIYKSQVLTLDGYLYVNGVKVPYKETFNPHNWLP